MIRSWRIARFKSVRTETSLNFAPLTLFTGANSAGKSTIIQSILLTAQTVQSTLQSRAVVLNGQIARLGAFRDVLSNDASERTILIGFELDIASEDFRARWTRSARGRIFRTMQRRGIEGTLHVQCNFTFSAEGPRDQTELLQLQPELEHCEISALLDNDESVEPEELKFRRSARSLDQRAGELSMSDEAQGQSLLESLRWEIESVKGAEHGHIGTQGKVAGLVVNHFLPEALSVVYDAVEEEVRYTVSMLTAPERRFADSRREQLAELPQTVRELVSDIVLEVAKEVEETSLEPLVAAVDSDLRIWAGRLRDAAPNDFVTALARFQHDVPAPVQVAIGNRLVQKRETLRELLRAGRAPRVEMRYRPLPETLGAGVEAVQQYFGDSVRYLGPLRDEPKPIYPLSAASDTRDVGFRGEHTAAVLDVHSNTQVSFIAPPPAPVDEQKSPGRTTLGEAVLRWLQYMGVGSDVQTRDRGKFGHDLRVAASGSAALHDLTHVGVGVSQVLPILVLSLLADPGATLIFEQPELHLHPRVQTRLADFFVSMTQLGKQCIVETHSEYLINRLRYRAATAAGDALSTNVVMFFVEKPGSESHYREVRINEYGVIEDWPTGFFDENEEVAAAILRAGLKKRRSSLSHDSDA